MNKENIGVEEELYLAPETEKIRILNRTDTNKYSFALVYTAGKKDQLLSELERIGCTVESQSDDTHSVVASMTLTQLATVKVLDCVERVETNNTVSNTTESTVASARTVSATSETASMTSNTRSNEKTICDRMRDAIPLELNEWVYGQLFGPGEEAWYKFTASCDTNYHTISTKGSLDTIGVLYDSNGEVITDDDDQPWDLNFKIDAYLLRGYTYYIRVIAHRSDADMYIIGVQPVVPVGAVIVCPPSKKLVIGESTQLTATVLPEHATNKSVTWSSDNPNVATVSSTGVVVAKGMGAATITATSAEGTVSSSMTLKVVDSVTIRNGEDSKIVEFESAGKIWHCVESDTIYVEGNERDGAAVERAKRNYFTNPDISSDDFDMTRREYTDEELRLLYAIDPYGVADYVSRYAFNEGSLSEVLKYKDRIFELLFNRKPRYFERVSVDGKSRWMVDVPPTEEQMNDSDYLLYVMSESESLFDGHPYGGGYAVLANIIDFAVEAAAFAIKIWITPTAGPLSPALPIVYSIIEGVADVVKLSVLRLAQADGVFIDEVMDIGDDITDFIDESDKWSNCLAVFDNASPSLLQDAFDLYTDTLQNLNDYNEFVEKIPQYFKDGVHYYTYETPYHIYMELDNGQKITVQDINDIINPA